MTRLIADREQVHITTNSLDIDAISLVRAAQKVLMTGSPGNLQSLRALFRGDFLEGLSVDRAPLFDNWLAGQRHRFGQLRQQLIERLSSRGLASRLLLPVSMHGAGKPAKCMCR
jgi:hypothetical protein